MNKSIVIIISVIVIIFLCVICSVSGDSTKNTTTSQSSIRQYKVIHSTGLYSSASIDATQIDILSIGTKLIPADGRSTIKCESFTDSGMSFSLCKVKLLNSNTTGWILKQWIE